MLDVALIGAGMAKALLASLKADGRRVKALAQVEAEKLAASLAAVGGMLAAGEIDQEEAEVLVGIQRAASEAVLASLQGVSAVAARRATRAALGGVAGQVDEALGVPLVTALLK